jgi:hypothetical protein
VEFKEGFMVPTNTFDNLKRSFPIGFPIWDLSKTSFPSSIGLDIIGENGKIILGDNREIDK